MRNRGFLLVIFRRKLLCATFTCHFYASFSQIYPIHTRKWSSLFRLVLASESLTSPINHKCSCHAHILPLSGTLLLSSSLSFALWCRWYSNTVRLKWSWTSWHLRKYMTHLSKLLAHNHSNSIYMIPCYHWKSLADILSKEFLWCKMNTYSWFSNPFPRLTQITRTACCAATNASSGWLCQPWVGPFDAVKQSHLTMSGFRLHEIKFTPDAQLRQHWCENETDISLVTT